MLTKEHNELLTRVGPGTPMGDMLREYWVPACRSAKLEADGAPERVRLFGENFVAFRATDGRIGFIGEGCPHRCASMALARNEGNGLRCIFHGWKVSVDGECIDAPTEPEERRAAFAKKAPVRSHPVREAGGVVWVYLGKNKASPPRFPDFEFTHLPPGHTNPTKGKLHANWLQGFEALLDSAHVSYLHSRTQRTQASQNREIKYMFENGAPTFEFLDQPYGFREGAIREQADGNIYARIREVVMPWWSFIPGAPGQGMLCCSIPMDDEWTSQWYIAYNAHAPISTERSGFWGTDSGDPDDFTSDMGDVTNMWHQDRKAMKEGHWSGIVGRTNAYEDFIVQESMGPIVDRSQEHLGQADLVIVRARKILIDAVRSFEKTGKAPFIEGVDFAKIRALSIAYSKGKDWKAFDPFRPETLAAAE